MTHPKKLIVAIHGAGMHAGVWGGLAGALDLPCQAITLPGHALAEGAPPATIEQMAAWVMKEKIVDHSPGSVILMGHSMGALVALEMAQHPAVCGVVLLGAAASMPVNPQLLQQAATDPEAAGELILKWSISPVHPQIATIRSILKDMMHMSTGALSSDLQACNNYRRGLDAAKAVCHPALVLTGLDDKMTKAEAGRALAESMPQASFHVMPDCGHMPMIEHAVETAREINAFADSLGN